MTDTQNTPVLARHLLNSFKAWLDQQGVAHRGGKGHWQALQVQTPDGWVPLHASKTTPDHLTPGTGAHLLVKQYLSETPPARPQTEVSTTPTPASRPPRTFDVYDSYGEGRRVSNTVMTDQGLAVYMDGQWRSVDWDASDNLKPLPGVTVWQEIPILETDHATE